MYVTSLDYATITERDQEEATDSRIQRACMLLDARIGNYPVNEYGWKLDIDLLPYDQKRAVQEWTCRAIEYLMENSDQGPQAESVTLGKFSVTKGQGNALVPGEMMFADSILVSTGMIRREVRLR